MHKDMTEPRFEETKKFVKEFLSKSSEYNTEEDRLSFLIYVIYRYRKNMFHGNKSLDSWLGYEEQITNCINSMITIMNEITIQQSILKGCLVDNNIQFQ